MKKIIHLVVSIALVAAALAIAPVQVARADSAVVGSGTPASCTEAALDAALAALYPGASAPGGVLSFNCGPNPHTIVVTSEKFLQDGSVIDGGGLITISGGNSARIFFVSQQARVEIHHITLTQGYAAGGGAIFAEPNYSGDFTYLLLNDVTLRANNSSSFGGAIGAQHTALTVTNSLLVDNSSEGGGGAISLNGGILVMSGSQVVGNSAQLAGSTGGGLDLWYSTLDIQTSTLRENASTLSAGGAIALLNSTGTITNNQIEQNSAATFGAGIYQTGGDLTLTQVTITDNTAYYGGGVANDSGILALNGDTTLTSNKATLGGGLYNFDGVVTAQTTRLLNNQAVAGGGIYNGSGSLELWNVTLDGNSATLGGISPTLGGGLYNNGSASLTRVTMNQNTSNDNGGAIYNVAGRTLILTNVTLSGNSASHGGGVYNSGSLSLLNVTITKNTALNSGGGLLNNGGSTALVMINTLFALNTANILNSDQCMLHKAPGTQVFSLWPGLSCGSSTANGNRPNTIAPLAPLGFTGTGLPSELTMTHALLPGSPAQDTGTCEYGTLTTDQRGVARPQGPACDIGAVEMPVITDNRSYKVAYQGWFGKSDTKAFGGGYRMSMTVGQTAIYTASAASTSISLITYKGPDQGKVQILVDGIARGTFDLYSAAPIYGNVITVGGLTNQKHTITIKVLGQKNAASSGNWVRVDGVKVGATAINELNIAMRFGTWINTAKAEAYQGTYILSNTTGASLTFGITGAQFTLLTARGPQYGKVDVYVDNVFFATYDLYNATQQWQYKLLIKGLTNQAHTIRIQVKGVRNAASTGNTVVLDAVTNP